MIDSDLDEEIRESVVEHVGAKRLLRDLVEAPLADDAWWAAVSVLRRQVEEHMAREEELVLPAMERLLGDEQQLALAREMEAFVAETVDAGEDAPLEAAISNADAREP